jgi:alkylated DNA repair dioxygenase AlkB
MNTLFPIETNYPEGFRYYPDFIANEEEERLINEISTVTLSTFTFQGFEAKRKTASFGYDYSFDKRSISKGRQIPSGFDFLIDKVSKKLSIDKNEFAELLVTEYPVGSVINWHRDAPPFDLIAGISLLADCTFKLRPYEKTKQTRSATINIRVARRSLYIIDGPARSDWQHSTAPVKQVRYSITLRTLRK